jgi:hypothetical protein
VHGEKGLLPRIAVGERERGRLTSPSGFKYFVFPGRHRPTCAMGATIPSIAAIRSTESANNMEVEGAAGSKVNSPAERQFLCWKQAHKGNDIENENLATWFAD